MSWPAGSPSRTGSAPSLHTSRRKERLDLSGSRLSRLPNLPVVELRSLITLNLSWNQLHVLPETQLGLLQQLRELDLSNNLFSTVAPLLPLGTLGRLVELDLRGNPLPFSGLTAHAELLRVLLLLAPAASRASSSASRLRTCPIAFTSASSLPPRPRMAHHLPRSSSLASCLSESHRMRDSTVSGLRVGGSGSSDGSYPILGFDPDGHLPPECAFLTLPPPRPPPLPFPRLRILSGQLVTAAERQSCREEREAQGEAGLLVWAKARLGNRLGGMGLCAGRDGCGDGGSAHGGGGHAGGGGHGRKPRQPRCFCPPEAEPWRRRVLEKHEIRTRERLEAAAAEEEAQLRQRLLIIYGEEGDEGEEGGEEGGEESGEESGEEGDEARTDPLPLPLTPAPMRHAATAPQGSAAAAVAYASAHTSQPPRRSVGLRPSEELQRTSQLPRSHTAPYGAMVDLCPISLEGPDVHRDPTLADGSAPAGAVGEVDRRPPSPDSPDSPDSPYAPDHLSFRFCDSNGIDPVARLRRRYPKALPQLSDLEILVRSRRFNEDEDLVRDSNHLVQAAGSPLTRSRSPAHPPFRTQRHTPAHPHFRTRRSRADLAPISRTGLQPHGARQRLSCRAQPPVLLSSSLIRSPRASTRG